MDSRGDLMRKAKRSNTAVCKTCGVELAPLGKHPNAKYCSLQCHVDAFVMPEPNSGCWLWTGRFDDKGYGRIKYAGRVFGAHRKAFEAAYGPINSSELYVCHRCDNPACVNPNHMFLGTSKDNMLDAAAKGRTLSGERNAAARLTASDVLAIRASNLKDTDLAKQYGVAHATVYFARTGVTWKHLAA